MENFLHRLKINLIGEAGLIVLTVALFFGTVFLFTISPVLGVLFFAVVTFVDWRFMRWIRIQDSYYADTEGRVRCRKCQKVVYGDGESAHGAAENTSIEAPTCEHTSSRDAATGTRLRRRHISHADIAEGPSPSHGFA